MLRCRTAGRHVWVEASKSTRIRQQHVLLQISSSSTHLRSLSATAYGRRSYATAPSPQQSREVGSTFHEPLPTTNIPKKPKVELHPAPKKFSDNGKSANVSPPIPPPSVSANGPAVSNTSSTPPASAPLDALNSTSTLSTPPLDHSYPKSSSSIQTAIEDLRKAEQHGIFTPPPEGAGKIGKGWHQLKQLAKFYFKGLKLLAAHRKTVLEIRKRLREESLEGKTARMTRWESQFMRTYRQDQVKLVPFLLILLTLEELLPLIALYMPSLLPSTCILPSQQERMDEKTETDRRKAIVDIKGWLQRYNDSALKLVDINLRTLDAGLSRPICRMFSVAGWGPAILQRRRLDKHLTYLAEDDALLEKEGSGARLSEPELRLALKERGFLTKNLQDTELRPLLASWINSTSVQGRIPAVILYARGFAA